MERNAMQAQKPGNRIEYVDAMRGFTMILVVILHVATYDLGLINSPDISPFIIS